MQQLSGARSGRSARTGISPMLLVVSCWRLIAVAEAGNGAPHKAYGRLVSAIADLSCSSMESVLGKNDQDAWPLPLGGAGAAQ